MFLPVKKPKFEVGDLIEAVYWPTWEKKPVTIRGVITVVFHAHYDVDLLYQSREFKVYPGLSSFREGNICRITHRSEIKKISALKALGDTF